MSDAESSMCRDSKEVEGNRDYSDGGWGQTVTDLRAQLAVLQAEKEAVVIELESADFASSKQPGKVTVPYDDGFGHYETEAPTLARWLSEGKP